MRLIDADTLENEIITDLEHTDIADYWIDYVVAIIKSAPTIDAEPKQGKWIETESEWDELIECSACGEEWVNGYDNLSPQEMGWHYCPNCGAKMEAEE